MDHMIAQSNDLDHQRPVDTKVLWRLLSYIKPYSTTATIALLLMALTSLTTLAGPYLVKLAIDTAIAGSDL
ncbi:MAG: ABC transporter ATP-binding protein, partial [Firmicutes bacterium]|nr:ABC transporter ATP-binding protein [Bacillota bacterium]